MSDSIFRLNLRHLRAVAATRRWGTISAAARSVSLSQPAVTQGIATLEREIGASLFDRRANGMVAATGGLMLAERVEAAFCGLRQGFQSIRAQGQRGFARCEHLLSMTQVRALLALASAGGFAAAAGATGLSQPSLHRAVRDLERLCGISLVERRGRGVGLTAAGKRLARAFSLAVAELQAGLEEIMADQGGGDGVVRVGAMPLARARLLPMAIVALYRERPEVAVEIVEGPYGELIERLRDGKLDFLIGALRYPEPGLDVKQTALFDERVVIVSRYGHPLAGTLPKIEALVRYPWVVSREGTPLRAHWQRLFESAGLPAPAAPVTCGSVMAIRTLLMETDFLTLLSPWQVRQDFEAGLLIPLGEPLPGISRPIGLTTRSIWRPTPAQARLLEEITSAAASMTLPLIE